jgi:hypothetical protein
MICCTCSTVTRAVTFTAKKCGSVVYQGVSVVITQSGTTVASGVTNSSGTFSTSLAAGSYSLTATDPGGTAYTTTFTVSTFAVNLTHTWVAPLKALVLDECGAGISGATVTWVASGGWTGTATTDATGNASKAPSTDLSGQSVSVTCSYSGAGSPTVTLASANLCDVANFSYTNKTGYQVTGCGSMPLQGATVTIAGSIAATGTGTTDATGYVAVTLTPPAQSNETLTFTVSRTNYVTQTGTGDCAHGNPCTDASGACESITLAPDATHQCWCCGDNVPVPNAMTLAYQGNSVAYTPGAITPVLFPASAVCAFSGPPCPPSPCAITCCFAPVSGNSQVTFKSGTCTSIQALFTYVTGESQAQCCSGTAVDDTAALQYFPASGMTAKCLDVTGGGFVHVKTVTFTITLTGTCANGVVNLSGTVPGSYTDPSTGLSIPLPGGTVLISS